MVVLVVGGLWETDGGLWNAGVWVGAAGLQEGSAGPVMGGAGGGTKHRGVCRELWGQRRNTDKAFNDSVD